MRNKSSILAFGLLALLGVSQVGCRMCQNCLDYGSPVIQNEGCPCSTGGGYGECRSGTCFTGEPTHPSMIADESVSEPVGPTILR